MLSIAQPKDMVESTRTALKDVDERLGGIDVILGFDCVLRRLDARNRQVFRDMSELYRVNNVIGFGTYGEQYRSMHLNQTLTGIAFGGAAGSGIGACRMPLRDIDDLERLKKINAALISRVERSMDQQGNAFSLFQTAINLESRVAGAHRGAALDAAPARAVQHRPGRGQGKRRAANLSKTRFLAAASHDVLQPLNAAHLSISALADLQTSDEGRKLVRQVERSLETMDDLLRTLLDISKLDAGVVRPDIGDVALEPLFSSLRSDFQPLADKKGLKLRFRPPALSVRSDRTLLRRILQNIVSNALALHRSRRRLVGARQRGDTIRDRCRRHRLRHSRGPARGGLRGVPPRPARRRMPSLSGGGLGLGLSIVRAHGRRARPSRSPSRSTVGRGTVFRHRACRSASATSGRGQRRAAEPERPRGYGLFGTKVLLVDNDAARAGGDARAARALAMRGARRHLDRRGARSCSATPPGCPTSSSPTSISTAASSARHDRPGPRPSAARRAGADHHRRRFRRRSRRPPAPPASN